MYLLTWRPPDWDWFETHLKIKDFKRTLSKIFNIKDVCPFDNYFSIFLKIIRIVNAPIRKVEFMRSLYKSFFPLLLVPLPKNTLCVRCPAGSSPKIGHPVYKNISCLAELGRREGAGQPSGLHLVAQQRMSSPFFKVDAGHLVFFTNSPTFYEFISYSSAWRSILFRF